MSSKAEIFAELLNEDKEVIYEALEEAYSNDKIPFAVDKDNDWQTESATYTFDDGSEIGFTGLVMEIQGIDQFENGDVPGLSQNQFQRMMEMAEECYLHYFNDFFSIKDFSEHFWIPVGEAHFLVELGSCSYNRHK